MRRVIGAVMLLAIGLALLSSCAIDPCSIDARSPSCAVQQTQAHATISALEGEQAMRSTQATLAIQGTLQAGHAQATQAAVQQRATDQVVNAEATKIALQVGGAIEKANAESAALPFATWFQIIAFWFVLPGLAVLAVIWSGRKIVPHVTTAMTQVMHKHVAMVTYGQENNSQIGYLLFDPKTDQPAKFITAEGLVGNFIDLLNNDTVLQSLNIPDDVRLATLVEASKRSQAARIAAATGLAPWARMPAHALGAPMPAAEASIAPVPFVVPTFAEMLKSWQPTSNQMLFGFGEGGLPVYGKLDQVLSALVIGRQGQGKTTLLRLIYLQCVMTAVKVMSWDVHDDIAEDVPGIECYTSDRDIEQSARMVMMELDRRIRLKLKNGRAQPVMILIDEVNSVIDRVPTLVEAIRRIVSEGRKYGIFEYITAKGAPSDIFEKSWARDSFSSLVSFWTSALQARNAGFESDIARRVEMLTPGKALLRLQTSPAQVVTFPDLPLADLQRLASAAPSHATSEPLPKPLPEDDDATSEEAEKAAESGNFYSPEVAEMVIAMWKAGKTNTQIIADVFGASGGQKYKDAAKMVHQIIREALP